ncbi:uncharacterized protein AAG666_012082 [Megaptera novaeangliae]
MTHHIQGTPIRLTADFSSEAEETRRQSQRASVCPPADIRRRKSKRKPPPKKKMTGTLETQFTCPFCNHEKSCDVKMDRARNTGVISCTVCLEEFQTPITYLSEPVDVYSDWIDACEAANQEQRRGPTPSAASPAGYQSRDIPGSRVWVQGLCSPVCVCGVGVGMGVSVCVAAGVPGGVSSWAWGRVEGLLGPRGLNCLPWLRKPLTCSLLWHLAPWLWGPGPSRDLCPDIVGEGKPSRGCLGTLQRLPPPHQHLSI